MLGISLKEYNMIDGVPAITDHAYERATIRMGLNAGQFRYWVLLTRRKWKSESHHDLNKLGAYFTGVDGSELYSCDWTGEGYKVMAYPGEKVAFVVRDNCIITLVVYGTDYGDTVNQAMRSLNIYIEKMTREEQKSLLVILKKMLDKETQKPNPERIQS